MRKLAGIKLVRETLKEWAGDEGKVFERLVDAGYSSASINRQLKKIRGEK